MEIPATARRRRRKIADDAGILEFNTWLSFYYEDITFFALFICWMGKQLLIQKKILSIVRGKGT